MTQKWDLRLQKSSSRSLKEQSARATLRHVRLQGHQYVDLREEGRRLIFFCTLCLTPCYNDSVLFDHLNGNLHCERLSAATLTLFKPNSWPFDDGVHFFNVSTDPNEPDMTNSALELNLNAATSLRFSIPDSRGDMALDLNLGFLGYGKMAGKFMEKDDDVIEVGSSIWCEWLGENVNRDDELTVPDHEFAVLTFPCDYDLGRNGFNNMPLSAVVTAEKNTKLKMKNWFSDPEDQSESLNFCFDSSGDESSGSNGSSTASCTEGSHESLLDSEIVSERETRQYQKATDKLCDICQQKMLPQKDVSTLLNTKTGKLACGSRNVNGVFHVFHTSCLVHWLLICEVETIRNHSLDPQKRKRPRRRISTRWNKLGKDGRLRAQNCHIDSAFCPECQGTGANPDHSELEIPNLPLSEMFKYKMKVREGHRGWMKCPEMLQNCSTGFRFISSSHTDQEIVKPLKLVSFYRSSEPSACGSSSDPWS